MITDSDEVAVPTLPTFTEWFWEVWSQSGHNIAHLMEDDLGLRLILVDRVLPVVNYYFGDYLFDAVG